MRKIFLLSLCALVLLLSGCFKYTSQEEYEAQQKKATEVTKDESLTLITDDKSAGSATRVTTDDAKWKISEFPSDLYHSYVVSYPESFVFRPDCATDTLCGTTFSSELGMVAIADYFLKGCPKEKLDCGYNERVSIAPSEYASRFMASYAKENVYTLTNKSVGLLQVKKPAVQYTASSGQVEYFIELDSGFIIVSFDKALAADTRFTKKFLDSIASAK